MARIHQGLGATMVSEAGWEMPGSYGDEDAERSAIREGLAIADVTPRGKIDVRGEVDDALATVPERDGGSALARVGDGADAAGW